MLNDDELWVDFFKTIVVGNNGTIAKNAQNADAMLQEYKSRFKTPSANQSVTWANVNSQTPNTRY